MRPAVIDHLIAKSAEMFGITPEELVSPCRKMHYVQARNMVADIAYHEYLFTYELIAKCINRTHGTLINNLEAFEVDCKKSLELRTIRQTLYQSCQDYLQNL